MIMSGCTATSTGISCPTPSGLAYGPHAIEVLVADNAGTLGTGTGTLTIEPPPCTIVKPTLSLSAPVGYWTGGYPGYLARNLSVTWTVNNPGTAYAANVKITGSTPNGGVTLLTDMPAASPSGAYRPAVAATL